MRFWSTQPVGVVHDGDEDGIQKGPIDARRDVHEAERHPYTLPPEFSWCLVDVTAPDDMNQLHALLAAHYVEHADDTTFRFHYTRDFLSWALRHPGWTPEWHVGVRVAATGRLVAFISGVKLAMRVRTTTTPMAEINFLCVHRKLRHKRLAPLLIKEITRRVHVFGNVWQAAYTAGVVLPTPMSTAHYWHRPLNPQKLVASGFTSLAPRMTMARSIKLHALPSETRTPRLRAMRDDDVPAVTRLLTRHLATYALAPVLSEDEVRHMLLPQSQGVVHAYVVEDEFGQVRDMVSFYSLPIECGGTPINTACLFYFAHETVPITHLLGDALVLAAQGGHDVFNTLDIMGLDESLLHELKFGMGDGTLHYYLFNWRDAPIPRQDIGFVMV